MSSTAQAPETPEVGTDGLLAEMEALRRKVDDNAAMIRRNQLSLGELADAVGKLVSQQRRRERSHILSSFVAYLLFTVLLGGGFLLLYRSRAGEEVAAKKRAQDDFKIANERANLLEQELKARDEASKAALAYWELLESGKPDQAIEAYGTLPAALTPTERELFASRVKQARGEIVDAGYLAGLDAFRAGKHKDAIPELERALGYEQDGERAARMRYYLGVSYAKTGDAKNAADRLELALVGGVEQNGMEDARYWHAVALEKLGLLEEARTEYDKFASAQPTHPYSVAARRKSAALARRATPRN
jgi:tetratricopeptide (TPR) repeat protein